MSEEVLELHWQEDDPENLLADFDIDEWLSSGNTHDPNMSNMKNTSTDISDIITHNSNSNDNTNTTETETSKQFKCPFCNEICDTYKALEVHCNLCLKSSKTNNTKKEQQKNSQKKWQNILNMNNKKRDRSNSKDDIIFSIPSKKRKIYTSPKITKMSKKNKKSKKILIQKTLEDVVKPCQKLNNNSNNCNKITPGFDIDLFPSNKDCMEIDEKSSQLYIKKQLKDNNINNKLMKNSFLKLNGIKNKQNEESIIVLESDNENDNDENTQLDCDRNKNRNDDPLSPVMMMTIDATQMEGMDEDENFVLNNIVSSNSSKKRKSKRSNKKKIEFIPPWKMS